MPVATQLMTVEEFLKLPDPTDGTYLELHHGEVVRLTFPRQQHRDIQHKIYELLKPVARDSGTLQIEFAFRAEAEHELRSADIAYVPHDRFTAINREGFLKGAPDLVIEVESPSNTAAELDEKEALCLANGCKEFWIVYQKRKIVRVSTGDTIRRYKPSESIPLLLFPGHSIAVSDIF